MEFNILMPTSHESMTVCEDEECVEGSVISPATVCYVHTFRTSIEVTLISTVELQVILDTLVMHSTGVHIAKVNIVLISTYRIIVSLASFPGFSGASFCQLSETA